MEIFDVLDCTGKSTGGVVSRDEAHRTGVWHGAFHCLVIYERENRRFALFQKRSPGKRIAPGRFDVSVGGHYAKGEDASSAGPREIGEELGLSVQYRELVPLGRRVFVYCFEPDVREYEFQDVFLLPRQVRSRDLLLQKEEVESVLELEIAAGIELFSRAKEAVDATIRGHEGSPSTVRVAVDQFVPCLDNYYLKLLLQAKQWFEGERTLLCI